VATREVANGQRRGGVMKGIGLRMGVLSSAFVHSQWAYAQQRGGFGSWGMGSGMAGGYGMGLFGSIFMVGFWVLVLAGLFFVVKWLVQGARAGHVDHMQSGSGALAILEERYARGEIDRQEFEQKKRDLRRS
jgi:putative membrane protein